MKTLQAISGDGDASEDLKSLAARELGAFIEAVTDSFGAPQAQLAADDWLAELEAAPLPELNARAFRAVTLASSVRLAARLNALSAHKSSWKCLANAKESEMKEKYHV